jgi:hypothetical protein
VALRIPLEAPICLSSNSGVQTIDIGGLQCSPEQPLSAGIAHGSDAVEGNEVPKSRDEEIPQLLGADLADTLVFHRDSLAGRVPRAMLAELRSG